MQLTELEACVLTAYTGNMFCKTFGEFHEYAEELLKRPVWTHEFANKDVAELLKSESKVEAMKIFASIEYVN